MTAITLNNDPTQVQASDIGGLVVFSPKGTTAPADPVAAWSTPWQPLGLIDDNGITTTYKKDHTDKMAWNVRGVVKRIPKSADFSFRFVAMQMTGSVHQLFYGSLPTVLTTSPQTRTDIKATSDMTEYSWGIDVPTTDGYVERYIVPRGVVTDIQPIKYSQADVKLFDVTVGAEISPGVSYLAYILSSVPSLATP